MLRQTCNRRRPLNILLAMTLKNDGHRLYEYCACREFLLSLKSSDAISTFLQQKNIAIDCLLSESSRDRVESFTKLVWFHSLLMIETRIEENPDDIFMPRVDFNRQGFTEVTSILHSFFISSDFLCYVCSIFDVTQCDDRKMPSFLTWTKWAEWGSQRFDMLVVGRWEKFKSHQKVHPKECVHKFHCYSGLGWETTKNVRIVGRDNNPTLRKAVFLLRDESIALSSKNNSKRDITTDK